MVTLRGERSRHFGPGPASTTLTLASDNVTSDLYFRGVAESGAVERLLNQPTADVREMVRGYAAGYNAYVSERHPAKCAAPVQQMTEMDVYRRVYAISTMLASGSTADGIVGAAPGTTAESADPAEAVRSMVADMSGPGSNTIALGRAATRNHRGINVANPHLPWRGDLLWTPAQLTIPGKYNASGAAFIGTPFVTLGHTENLAWSGTIADAVVPLTLFELKLDGPTSYLVDGKSEAMRRRDVTVPVKQADGSVRAVTRTQWSTRYGPVTTNLRGMALPWTDTRAYAIADPNTGNLRMLNMFAELGRAQSTADLTAAIRRTQGSPIFNLTAADSAGRTVYSGMTVVPNVSDEQAARCSSDLGRTTFANGLAVLDGSRSDCRWGNDTDAAQPGIFGPGNLPVQERSDYVANSNQSYWLTNAAQPMRKFPRVVGDFETPRNVRTRDTLVEITEGLGRFDLGSTQDLVLSNRMYAAEITVDDTVALCRQLAIGKPCDVLAQWDRRADVDSRGALLFSGYWSKIGRASGLWKVPFDVKDPVGTPRSLDTANPIVAKALREAVADLAAAGIAVDAPLGKHQHVNGIPIGGGRPETGTFNAIASDWKPGYTAIGQARTGANSTGYLRVVAFNGTGCPDARVIIGYQQPELLSRKQWITERFCEQDIRSAPGLRTVRLRSA